MEPSTFGYIYKPLPHIRLCKEDSRIRDRKTVKDKESSTLL